MVLALGFAWLTFVNTPMGRGVAPCFAFTVRPNDGQADCAIIVDRQ